jgi:NAD(P)H-hydrate epimerase
LHLKNVPSITSDGCSSYWNIYGNAGMATGGSGDVLTGLIVSLLSQGLEPLLATAAASFIHSEAGDIYAVKYGEKER